VVFRTVALYAVPALLIASGWLRLESEGASRGLAFWMVLLALLPALARPVWARAAVAVAALLLVIRAAFGLSVGDARPFDDRHDFFGPALSGFRDGLLQFWDVTLPFEGSREPLMLGVVLLGIFGFCLAVALALAARRPLAAGIALLAGAAWPATLVSGAGLQRGAVILAAVLALLAWGGRRRPQTFRQAAVAGTALVAAALVATTSPAVAKGEFLSWKRWDPYDRPEDPVGVRYVWNANYGGIRFPEKVTTVLRVTGPRRAHYWRATTLDVFRDGRWVEQLATISASNERFEVLSDPLLPQSALDRARWLRADVSVGALRDRRLAGPSMPVAYDPRGMGRIEYRPGGTAVVDGGFERGDRYTVWSYAPRPTPEQLAKSRLNVRLRNTVHSQYLELAPGAAVLPFGTPGRQEQLRNLLSHSRFRRELGPYVPLYRQARALVGARAPNQYAAVVALEGWFRSGGGFAYDEQPPVPVGLDAPPALVAFVTGHKRGYCQHYAGAMALMLRYLGIPARVAAGFTSGDYDADDRRWTVTDHDAHAWVEVWFDGWGWLPFDPTPGRGQLSGTYSMAAAAFNVQQAQQVVGAGGGLGLSLGLLAERLEGTRVGGGDLPGDVGAANREGDRGASLLRLLAILVAALVALIAVAKVAMRRSRYVTRDPRRTAAACRRELIDFLVDQRVDVARSATLADLAQLVSAQLAVDARSFASAAAAARFAPPAEARTAARRARRELRALLRRLRRRLGPFERARGLLSVRSLGFNG
jgi:transglutaminase-like putative cysteine protease